MKEGLPGGLIHIGTQIQVNVARVKPGGVGIESAPIQGTLPVLTREAWNKCFDELWSAIEQAAQPK